MVIFTHLFMLINFRIFAMLENNHNGISSKIEFHIEIIWEENAIIFTLRIPTEC